jgi:hypothetical protein
MSLAVTLIFYYFSRSISLWAGASSILICLATFMVWGYWAEDRLYSFWFLMTSAQALYVLKFIQYPSKKDEALRGIIATNILLSLTTPLSILQIAAASAWVFIAGYRKITDFVWAALIPIAICLLYYHHSPKYSFIFILPAWKVFTANIPIERFLLILIGGSYLIWNYAKPMMAKERLEEIKSLVYFGLIFLAGIGLLLIFKLKEAPAGTSTGPVDFSVEGRYIIFLAPAGIIAMTYIFSRLMQINRSMKARVVLVLLLLSLTLPRVWRYTHSSFASGGLKSEGSLLSKQE